MEKQMLTKKTTLFKSGILLLLCLYLSACGKETTTEKTSEKQTEQTASTEKKAKPISTKPVETKTAEVKENKPLANAEEISWEALVPPDYDPNAAINHLVEQLNGFEDNDQEALEIYQKIQVELDNAPVNADLDGKIIKMPGFIAPLENNNGIIDEFLLVPYFGACIHVPAPPLNQTVMVKTDKGQGVKTEESDFPVWITGKIVAVEEKTNIGAAGYRIEDPFIEPYEP